MAGTGAETAREIVLDILAEHERKGTYSSILIKKAMDRHPDLPASDRAFVKRLCEGTLERQIELDAIIRKYLKNPDTVIKPYVRCMLRMSVYQIFYMDSVPDFAACNEAVTILRRNNQEKYCSFVNGVLRSICRDKQKTAPSADAGKQPAVSDDRTVRYSTPAEVLSILDSTIGREETGKLLEAMQEVRPVCIRFDPRTAESDRQEILAKMQSAGIEVLPGRYVPDCRYLKHIGGSVADLYGFRQGMFTVQDESSALTAYGAGLFSKDYADGEGMTVLDLCAAPGGKSILTASLLPKASVYSFDLTRTRTDKIRISAKRMHCPNMIIGEHDASEFDERFEEKADIVLCDVPCSGLGVITRKRDIKYNISGEKIRSLVSLQRKILRNAVRYVKPGGVLIYSTCTINSRENSENARFIEKQTGLVPEDLTAYMPGGITGIQGGQLQLLPHIHGTDGFFIARFIKPEK